MIRLVVECSVTCFVVPSSPEMMSSLSFGKRDYSQHFRSYLLNLMLLNPLTKENGHADSRWLYKPVKPDSVFSNVNNDSCLLLASLLSKV